jgi:hypothetical protein
MYRYLCLLICIFYLTHLYYSLCHFLLIRVVESFIEHPEEKKKKKISVCPHFRCKQIQENQALAWFFNSKEKDLPKQEILDFLETTVHRVVEKAENQQKPGEKSKVPEKQVLWLIPRQHIQLRSINFSGKRNYRYFYLFLLSLSFHCVFIFTCSLSHLILLSKQSSPQDKASRL